MKTLLKIVSLCCLLLFIMTACSENRDNKSVDEKAREAGKELAESIQRPIDKAEAVKELSEKLNEKTKEAAAND